MGIGFLIVSKIKRAYKIIFLLFLIAFVFYGVAKNSNKNALRSLAGFQELVKKYNENMGIVNSKDFVFKELRLEAQLYQDNKTSLKRFIQDKIEEYIGFRFSGSKKKADTAASPAVENKITPKLNVTDKQLAVSGLSINDAYGSSLFRIFIWKDAFRELLIRRQIFGFDFGKPFRSRTIEILGWASEVWKRDGWLCLHNSYIDIVYRAGILGILMVISLLTIIFSLIVKSFRDRYLTGVLLTGILINWFISANFLEILEMPYSAIPLWCLFGLTAAYLFKKRPA
jgi:hypothetical protein